MKYVKQLSAMVFGSAVFVNGAVGAQVFVSDVIVQGSECVGVDCANGESFGFDTLRLKENNLRMHFQDTSTSASFPTNDWRLIANDSSNGGGNYFAIEDSNAGRKPFTVEAGAPANTLYAEADGDVGIKTSNPVVDLHIVEGNTPTMRLEQDGSDGFTPQTWDVAGNESNFFIRDVTNGSKLSFRIRPGAPESSIDIAADGDVGVGTSSPGTLAFGTHASVHVRRTDGAASMLIEEASGTPGSREMLELRNNGGQYITFRNTSSGDDWFFTNENAAAGRFIVDSSVNTGPEFALSTNGNLEISGDLTTGGTGACSSGCDAVFDPDYNVPSIEDHAEYMFKNRHLEAVGATSENGPFNITQKVGGVLNELEKAHIYIAELNERLAKIEKALLEK